jgi:hypothetical protein
MTSGSSLQLPERGYSSKPSPGTLGADSLSSRPNSPTTLPGNPVHVNDARGRNTTPPVENPVLVKPYPNPRPNGRRALLVTTLQDLLRLRVPVLYRNQSFSSQSLRHNRKIPTSQILVQSFARIVDIGDTYICEHVSTLRLAGGLSAIQLVPKAEMLTSEAAGRSVLTSGGEAGACRQAGDRRETACCSGNSSALSRWRGLGI